MGKQTHKSVDGRLKRNGRGRKVGHVSRETFIGLKERGESKSKKFDAIMSNGENEALFQRLSPQATEGRPIIVKFQSLV